MTPLLHEAAQCSGVQPSESHAFTSPPHIVYGSAMTASSWTYEVLDDGHVAGAYRVVQRRDALVVGARDVGHERRARLDELEVALKGRVEEERERVEADARRTCALHRHCRLEDARRHVRARRHHHRSDLGYGISWLL